MLLSMKDQNGVFNSFLIGTNFKPIMGVLYDILLLFYFVLLSDAYLILGFKQILKVRNTQTQYLL